MRTLLIIILLISSVPSYSQVEGDSTSFGRFDVSSTLNLPITITSNQLKSAQINQIIQVSGSSSGMVSNAVCPSNSRLLSGSCNFTRGGDGRIISPITDQPNGNGWYCNEGNGGTSQAIALCGE